MKEEMKIKLQSRTFWFAVLWSSFVPLSIVAQIFIPTVEIPIGTIVGMSGSITLAYVGGEKLRDTYGSGRTNK